MPIIFCNFFKGAFFVGSFTNWIVTDHALISGMLRALNIGDVALELAKR
jgi:hypothetical protein